MSFRCKMVKRCKRTCTTDIHVDVLSKKRQHVDGGDQSERPRNLRKTKTLARESSGAQSLLRRRSVRLGSKVYITLQKKFWVFFTFSIIMSSFYCLNFLLKY